MTDHSGQIACVLIAHRDALVICLSKKREHLKKLLDVKVVSSITKIIDELGKFIYRGAYDWLNDEKNVADLEYLFKTANKNKNCNPDFMLLYQRSLDYKVSSEEMENASKMCCKLLLYEQHHEHVRLIISDLLRGLEYLATNAIDSNALGNAFELEKIRNDLSKSDIDSMMEWVKYEKNYPFLRRMYCLIFEEHDPVFNPIGAKPAQAPEFAPAPVFVPAPALVQAPVFVPAPPKRTPIEELVAWNTLEPLKSYLKDLPSLQQKLQNYQNTIKNKGGSVALIEYNQITRLLSQFDPDHIFEIRNWLMDDDRYKTVLN
jgi:hypothetical protein